MPLQLGCDPVPGDVDAPACLQLYELDIGSEPGEIDGKAGRGLLQPERLLDDIVTTEYANACAGNVSWGEERKTHDVVPVHMGHEHVDHHRLRFLGRHDAAAEGPRAAAHVACQVFRVPGLDLHAG